MTDVAGPTDAAELQRRLDDADYLVDRGLATALFLAIGLPQPILLEGEAGVGKTEAAKALAAVLDTPLLRLQCYEGIDAAEALYEWNYPRQLLSIRLAEAAGSAIVEDDLFGPDHLIARPLLQAIEHPGPRPVVLLIDEVDRADDEFEAFLLELLAEGAVTIPELGTRHAAYPPVVVLTSNRTRDLGDALKRRCLYHWIDYPSVDAVARIVRRRVPAASTSVAEQAAAATARLRRSPRASPRPSIGCRRSRCWAPPASPPPSSTPPSAPSSSTGRTTRSPEPAASLGWRATEISWQVVAVQPRDTKFRRLSRGERTWRLGGSRGCCRSPTGRSGGGRRACRRRGARSRGRRCGG